jgi:hypothetical protein
MGMGRENKFYDFADLRARAKHTRPQQKGFVAYSKSQQTAAKRSLPEKFNSGEALQGFFRGLYLIFFRFDWMGKSFKFGKGPLQFGFQQGFPWVWFAGFAGTKFGCHARKCTTAGRDVQAIPRNTSAS